MRSAALRMRRHRKRLAAGRVVLQIEVDEDDLCGALVTAGLLDPLLCDDREARAHGVERLVGLLATGNATG
jgi:hypothetical protein